MPHKTKPRTILEEAYSAVEDRKRVYGPPKEDFARQALLWSAILNHPVRPEDVPLCLIATKISREVHSPKVDNRVDIAGYAAALDDVVRDREVGDGPEA